MKHILITTIAAMLLVGCGKPQPPQTSMNEAAFFGNIEVVKQHLADGVGVDIKDEHGRTPLCLAVSSRDKETVQLLIDKGADVNFKMDVFGGTRTLLDIVIMESADMPTLPPDAFTMGSPGMPTLPDDFTSRGEPGDGMPSEAEVEQYTAKLWAEMYGTDKLKEIADLLRKHGAKTGNELLAEESILGAAGVGDNKLVEKHLADGADVNEKGNKGETPLHLAATKEVAELLIAKGAEVNEKDLDGETPLDWRIGMEFFPAFDPTEVNKNAKKVNDEITTLLRKHGGKTGDELRAEGK